MRKSSKYGALTKDKKAIVKRLLQDGKALQDIQAIINFGRKNTINSARVTEVKKDESIVAASSQAVKEYLWENECFDPRTRLNTYRDERLVRAREAMIQAVTLFNNPTFKFKSKIFCILANTAWTYLLHQYFLGKGIKTVRDDGKTISLTQMLNNNACSFLEPVKENIRTLIKLRDAAEHSLLSRTDQYFISIFQANCLNFNTAIIELFGENTSLSDEFSLALQFSRIDTNHLETLQRYDLPEKIAAVQIAMETELSSDILRTEKFQARVLHTTIVGSKSSANMTFSVDDRTKPLDHRETIKLVNSEKFKYRPTRVADLVKETHSDFTQHQHTAAWKRFRVRPLSTDKDKKIRILSIVVSTRHLATIFIATNG